MTGYVLRRIGQAVIVVLGVTAVTFLLEHLIPGSLARAILGTRASGAEIAAFDRANGLDHPLAVQYLTFLGRLARGNLGYSYRLNQSVDSLVVHQLPNDVLLVGTALILALAIAIPLGIVQAVHARRAVDHLATSAAFALYSMPSYWLAILLIAGLSIAVHAFPPEAPQAATVGGLLADPRALALPSRWSMSRCSAATCVPPPSRRWPRTTCGWPGRRAFRPGSCLAVTSCATRLSRSPR
jgi:peptide/nickel transport system permease protein